jgi:CRISPR-associated protein Csb2
LVPDDMTRERLDALARDTAYVGHSTSLTRCHFVDDDFDLSDAASTTRTVYEGRLLELERLFRAGRRPNPGDVDLPGPGAASTKYQLSKFSAKWIILADDGGSAPDIRATAIVARTVRDALMRGYQRAVGDIPEWLSGHRPDGSPSTQQHVAVIPLADVGWKFSEGRFMGCAIIPPRDVSPDLLNPAIEQLLRDGASDSQNIELHYGSDACWYLVPTQTAQKASLRSTRWIGHRETTNSDSQRASRLWTTATPIVLDRFPKKPDLEEREVEIVECIRQASRNIGLPAPSYVSVNASSSLRGVPGVRAGRSVPVWQRWQTPSATAGRYLVHATLRFDDPVEGPVILGAGRYLGLGLCLPIKAEEAS